MIQFGIFNVHRSKRRSRVAVVFSLYIFSYACDLWQCKKFFAVLFTKSVYVYVMKIQWCQRQTNVIMWHSAAFKVEKLRKNFVESKFSCWQYYYYRCLNYGNDDFRLQLMNVYSLKNMRMKFVHINIFGIWNRPIYISTVRQQPFLCLFTFF